ncbi:hypothetical protein COOONC_08415, partial [Cooperia oncophora]
LIHYASSQNEIPLIFRAPKSIVTYQLADENSHFDVSPFSGDIFSKSSVPPGKHELVVIAKNSIGQESTATVTVVVKDEKAVREVNGSTNRLRRQLSEPVVVKLKENSVADFPKRIPLYAGEVIAAAPIVREHVTVLPDGTVKVTKPLNFEKTRHLSESVQIDGKRKCEPFFFNYTFHAFFFHFDAV